MKKNHIRLLYFIVLIGAVMGIALISAAAATPNTRSHSDLAAAAFYQPQAASPTPTATSVSRVGSTDGIVLLGFIIAVIILMPILLNKATWKKAQGDSD